MTTTRTVPGARLMTGTLEHEIYCTNRPGESEPRIESYQATRYADDGTTVASQPVVTRCVECGAQEVREPKDP